MFRVVLKMCFFVFLLRQCSHVQCLIFFKVNVDSNWKAFIKYVLNETSSIFFCGNYIYKLPFENFIWKSLFECPVTFGRILITSAATKKSFLLSRLICPELNEPQLNVTLQKGALTQTSGILLISLGKKK